MAAAIWTVLVAATAATVLILLRRAQAARTTRRSAFLSAVAGMFDRAQVAIQPTGFPRLSGWYAGELFDLQVVPDTLSLRKLPTLWVQVSLPAPMPVTGAVDLLLRPTGMETFTNFSLLPVQVQTPPGFPPDCAIRTETAGPVPLAGALRMVLGAVDNDRLKEVLITPKGVRLVFLANEANRGRYLLFRDSEMARAPLDAERLMPFLAAARALHDAVLCQAKERRWA